jgi:hypothetical protein
LLGQAVKGDFQMGILIGSEDQKSVNLLRIDLAQVTMDLVEIQVQDIHSRHAKEVAIERLRSIKSRMDALGIQHSCAKRGSHG